LEPEQGNACAGKSKAPLLVSPLFYDMKPIEVFVNNRKYFMEKNFSIVQLLEFVKLDSHDGVAVALNNEVVPKSLWPAVVLKNNDKITLINATAGG
jgi:sulfur carrier protein